jgi:hypothetical protein
MKDVSGPAASMPSGHKTYQGATEDATAREATLAEGLIEVSEDSEGAEAVAPDPVKATGAVADTDVAAITSCL